MLQPNFSPFPQLITERLLLRQMTLADASAVKALRSNTEVMKYINRPLTQTIEEAEKWITIVLDALERNDGISWCISMKEAPALHVGNIGLWRIEKENYRAEIGYMLEPDLQGKGIMYEAIQEVIRYGFDVMKLHSIEAHIDPRNLASAALLKKAGFIQEGYYKENYFLGDSFADTAVFSLLTPHRETAGKEKYIQEAVQS